MPAETAATIGLIYCRLQSYLRLLGVKIFFGFLEDH